MLLDLILEVLVGGVVPLHYQNLHSLIMLLQDRKIYLQAVPFVLVSFRPLRGLSFLTLSPSLLGFCHIVLIQDSLCGLLYSLESSLCLNCCFYNVQEG